MPERRALGFGRRDDPRADDEPSGRGGPDAERPWPEGATRLDDDLVAALLPPRPIRGHKGAFGRLLVIAGSLDYAGAALLTCRAAGRAGVGLVTLAVPESLQPLFAAKVVEATTMALPEDDVEEIDPEPALARILDHEHDAIVVGPGLRPGLATAELVRQLIAAPGDDAAPIVLDAEALRSIATIDGWWDGERRPAVLTPHAGEFARLRAGSGREDGADGDLADDDTARVAAARDAATTWRQVVVLKGARTVIAAPDGEVAVAPFENPALASGGTGDVLAGAIGAAAGPGSRAVRGGAARGVPPRGRRRGGPRAVRRRRAPGVGPARRPGHRPQAPRHAGRAQAMPGKRLGFGAREADAGGSDHRPA